MVQPPPVRLGTQGREMSGFLSLRDVWVEYGDKIVLERVNLEIE